MKKTNEQIAEEVAERIHALESSDGISWKEMMTSQILAAFAAKDVQQGEEAPCPCPGCVKIRAAQQQPAPAAEQWTRDTVKQIETDAINREENRRDAIAKAHNAAPSPAQEKPKPREGFCQCEDQDQCRKLMQHRCVTCDKRFDPLTHPAAQEKPVE